MDSRFRGNDNFWVQFGLFPQPAKGTQRNAVDDSDVMPYTERLQEIIAIKGLFLREIYFQASNNNGKRLAISLKCLSSV